jgi:hypothetical protein
MNYDPNEGFIYIHNVDIKFSAHDANNYFLCGLGADSGSIGSGAISPGFG